MDTLASSPCSWMRSSITRYSFAAAFASGSVRTLSPRRSSDAVIFLALSTRTASSAVSSVSPATKREANRFANPLRRTSRNTLGWFER
jgi:hypothetical protein